MKKHIYRKYLFGHNESKLFYLITVDLSRSEKAKYVYHMDNTVIQITDCVYSQIGLHLSKITLFDVVKACLHLFTTCFVQFNCI